MRPAERLASRPSHEPPVARPARPVASSAARVLALQRSAGNAAVVRLMERRRSLQRAPLPSAAGLIAHFAADPRADIVAVRTALQAHTAVANDNTQLPAQIRALGDLDRAIYAVFGGARPRNLRDAPEGGSLLQLLDESEAEHAQVVDAMRNLGGVEIPVELARLPFLRRARAAELWGMLHRGEGALRVEGPPAYTRPIFSQLARLLATPAGVSLLDLLVTGMHGHQVRIAPTIPAALDPSRAPADSSYAVPADPAVQSSGYEFDRAAGPAGLLPIDDARGILDALAVNRPGFVLDGRPYAFSPGTGAIVVIHPHPHADPNQPALAGLNDEAILNPGWVTLGHELGHAAKMAGGAGTPSHLESFGAMSETERMVWGNRAEEHLNITGVENPLRAQGGLSQRRGHKTQKAVLLLDRREELRNLVRARCATLNRPVAEFYELPIAVAVSHLIANSPVDDIVEDEPFAHIKESLKALLSQVHPKMFPPRAPALAGGGH